MIVTDELERRRKKRQWSVLKSYPRIYLEEFCKITKNLTFMITGVGVENKWDISRIWSRSAVPLTATFGNKYAK